MSKHKLGQYFTESILLKNKVKDFILNNPKTILEPSVGQGDLVSYIKNTNINFDMFEIDKTIKPLDGIDKNKIIYKDFIKENIEKSYTTIIGNPPFIRTKKGNLYIDFVHKCFNLLKENGELIFIIPSDFFKLTSSSKLLILMLKSGTFTHIFHPNDEKLFKDASIDVIVFRYCKNQSLPKKVLYNDNELHIINSNGLITFNTQNTDNFVLFKDYFHIYVGLVSGKEGVYKNNELGNFQVLNGKEKIDNYIFIKEFPSGINEIDNYLKEHKEKLINRKIKKFNEKNWFEWGAPRNIKNIENNINKKCIYISNLTRKTKVSFIDKVQYFGGGLICLIPKYELNLEKICKYINSIKFRQNFIFSGRFKIGHRQISNSFLPKKLL
jgi:adenine-specific DNA-methyltransferase